MQTNRVSMTVSQLNMYLSNMLREDPLLRLLSVRGEISNFHSHSSGHLYFSMKDEGAVIRCVMFREHAQKLDFRPDNGMRISAEGYVSLYARDGQIQLYCESMRRDGIGDYYLRFEELKEKLRAEGLFDVSRKKPLPELPRAVGVVTSPTGAAVRDILRVAQRRHPGMRIVISPAKVQGEGAAEEIARAVRLLADMPDIDVIIIGRGGGSIEDLWAFNEEIVARAVAACPIPIVSGVGHETDFTIADFCADVRASTPSNAAELAVPESASMVERRDRAAIRLHRAIQRRLDQENSRLTRAANATVLQKPETLFDPAKERLSRLSHGLDSTVKLRLDGSNQRLHAFSRHLEALNPTAVLSRGYAILFDAEGKAVSAVNDIKAGQVFDAQLRDGRFRAMREG